MIERRLGTVDLDTGELVEGVSVIAVQQRPRFKEAFMLVFQRGLQELAHDKTLRGESIRVLFILMSVLDYENFVHVPQTTIARELDIAASNVSRAISQLVKRGVLIVGPKVGNVNTYRLSDTLGWRGRVSSFNEARKRRLALVHTRTPSTGGKSPQRRS